MGNKISGYGPNNNGPKKMQKMCTSIKKLATPPFCRYQKNSLWAIGLIQGFVHVPEVTYYQDGVILLFNRW